MIIIIPPSDVPVYVSAHKFVYVFSRSNMSVKSPITYNQNATPKDSGAVIS